MTFMSSRATAVSNRMRRGSRQSALVMTAAALGILALGGCQSAGNSDPSETASRPAGPISVEPQRDWDDAIIYFALVDRFADGIPAHVAVGVRLRLIRRTADCRQDQADK